MHLDLVFGGWRGQVCAQQLHALFSGGCRVVALTAEEPQTLLHCLRTPPPPSKQRDASAGTHSPGVDFSHVLYSLFPYFYSLFPCSLSTFPVFFIRFFLGFLTRSAAGGQGSAAEVECCSFHTFRSFFISWPQHVSTFVLFFVSQHVEKPQIDIPFIYLLKKKKKKNRVR